MKPKWLIEDFNDDTACKRLAEEVRTQGFECQEIKYIPFESGTYDCWKKEEIPGQPLLCVVFYGSLNLGRQLRREKNWCPGVICDLEQFKCSSYYPFLGKYLLNDEYIMLPVRELPRRKEWIYWTFGVDNCVFIRPNSGFKTFSGMPIPQEDFDNNYIWMEEWSDPNCLAVIARPKYIEAEYRFVVCQKQVITGSSQRIDGKLDIEGPVDPDAWTYAQEIASLPYQPEDVYMLDVCKTPLGYRLMELNSFSGSGLYSCDPKIVVERVSKYAEEKWKDEYN